MIDYISGRVAELTPTNAVIDVSGIGYDINITLIDFDQLQGKQEAKLFIYEAIREDAHLLYGFCAKRSRDTFVLLTSVSGVGPNTARLILSSMTVDQLENAISSGQEGMLKNVKGIGSRTAQRIIVDLKDKIKAVGESFITSSSAGENFDDASAALVMLGFTQQQSRKVLQKLFAKNPALSAEEAIKQALTMM